MSSPARYRFRFEKRGPARFLSHRDLLRLFERAGRRGALPLAFTEGFNPHPRMSVPLALRLGWEGWEEALELDLTEEREPKDLADALNRTLPQGVRMLSARPVALGRRSPPLTATYRITLPLNEEEIRRSVDSSPPIPGVADLTPGEGVLDFTVALDQPRPPKPAEVVEALLSDLVSEPWMFTRTRIRFADAKENI